MKGVGLFLAFFCMATLAKAQVGELRNNWYVGVNAGVNLNSVGFTPTISQKKQIAPSLGVTFRYTCEKYFSALCSFQAELNVGQHGWTEDIRDGNDQPTGENYSRKITYVQLPLLCRLAWGREYKGAQAFLNLGPQIGYALFEKEKANFSFPVSENQRPNGVTGEYGKKLENHFDYGIVGGVGAEIGTGIGRFGIEGRYYFGLANIFKNSKRDYFSKSNLSAIELRVSYLTDFGKVFKKNKKNGGQN